jgi:hypothetical protein
MALFTTIVVRVNSAFKLIAEYVFLMKHGLN